MTADQEQRLTDHVKSLASMPWFASAGMPSDRYRVAADAVVAWDDWSPQMVAVWVPSSERLEALAQGAIGDAAIDDIFKRIDAAIVPALEAGVRAYFARRPETRNTEAGADLGLRTEIVDVVIRDMSWAAIEAILEQREFYTSLMPVYGEGRWPCSWDGQYPRGRFVVL